MNNRVVANGTPLDTRFDTEGKTFAGTDQTSDCLAAFALNDAESRLFVDAETGALTEKQVGDGVKALVASLDAAAGATTGGVSAGLTTAAADMATFEKSVRTTGKVPEGMTQESLLAGTAAALRACSDAP